MTLSTEAVRAIRGAISRPGFTALTLVALGLGIGMNTAIFSLVHALLLKSLPYAQPERLVRVWESRPRMGPQSAEIAALSTGHFRAWRDTTDVFSAMAIYQDASFNMTGGPEPLRVEGQRVSPALFSMLGVEPMLGRVFTEDEEVPGSDRVVVLSIGLWRRLFGGDEWVGGRVLRLDGEAYVVVGVMPTGFRFPHPATELWVPLAASAPPAMRPGEMRLELVPVIARLAPGVGLEEAEASGRSFLDEYRSASPMARRMDDGVEIHLTSLHDQLVRPIRPAVLVLFGAVTFVLLLVCANVANLFLARAQERETEMAVRSALGAGRARLAGQLLLESLVHGVAGGALGVLVAHWTLRLLQRMEPADTPLLDGVALNGTVLVFNVALAFATALLVGLLPALRASKVDVVSGLKGLSTSGARGRRSRNALVVAEVGIALVLFVAAGLLLRSFLSLTRTDPGYEPRDVLAFRLSLPETRYGDAPARRAFFDRLRERLARLPGVSAAGLVNMLPLDQGRLVTHLDIEGRPPAEDPMSMPRASVRIASPGFFEAMGMRMVSGRSFEEIDGAGAPPVVIVNESLVRRYLANDEPMGRRIVRMGEIVGIVADVRQEGLDAEPEPEIFLDYRQVPDGLADGIAMLGVVVRHRPRASGLLESVKAAVRVLDPDIPLADVRTMESRLADSVARPRLYAALLSLFAAMALVIAAAGVYSVVSYQVTERTRETGLRMALGATSSDILGLVMRGSFRILAWGLALGLVGSFLLSRSLSSVLYQVAPFDPWTVVTVSLVVGGAVLVASALPARRAARMDPMSALRYE